MNPAFLGIATASIWGVHDLIAGVTSRRIGFLPTIIGSTLFGLLVLSVWLGVSGDFPALIQEDIWIAYCSGFGYTLATMFLFAALSAGPMSLAVPLAGSYPVSSLIIAAISGVTPSSFQLLLAAVVILGVFMVSMAKEESASQQFDKGWFKRTVVFGLCSHLCFAIGIWLGQSAAVSFGTIEATWLARISGLAILLVILVFSKVTVSNVGRFVPVVALIGFLDVIAISCLNYAGHTSQPEVAIVIGSTFGPVTVLLARVFLKEHISWFRWLGIAITFSGVAGLTALS